MKPGRPKGTKNNIRSPEEKERILLYAKRNGISQTSREYNLNRRTIKSWLLKYQAEGFNGLISQSGKKHGKSLGRPKKNPSELDLLKVENLKLKIENERLKKGYLVKGVGIKKEYVTIKELNSK